MSFQVSVISVVIFDISSKSVIFFPSSIIYLVIKLILSPSDSTKIFFTLLKHIFFLFHIHMFTSDKHLYLFMSGKIIFSIWYLQYIKSMVAYIWYFLLLLFCRGFNMGYVYVCTLYLNFEYFYLYFLSFLIYQNPLGSKNKMFSFRKLIRFGHK